jgi:branched-chain amino acid transport system substrate-binding protein
MLKRRTLLAAAALAAAAWITGPARAADDKTIKFGFAQDFTVVYTFVTSEYNQGQRDYLTLLNKSGGIHGFTFEPLIVDHGNAPQRGIEAYDRFKSEGVILVDLLSTPVSRAVVPRALKDKINLITLFSGRSDAADGETFPYVLPLTPSYWSQAAALIDYMQKQSGGDGLKGKKIAYVHIDSPFGREPLPLLQELSKRVGFELGPFPYPSPGNEQSAVWTQVRRFQPDWTIIWGGGVGQTVAVREAIRNGIKLDHLASVIWLSESDMQVVGPDQAKGILKFEGAAGGRSPALIKAILKEVVEPGQGAGPADKVGTTYYNIGVASMAIVAEGVRLALDKDATAPLTAERLNDGLTRIKDFTAEGLIPPLTITKQDHQGGGAGRIAQWDGSAWVDKSGWAAAYQDVVWDLIRKSSASFREKGE